MTTTRSAWISRGYRRLCAFAATSLTLATSLVLAQRGFRVVVNYRSSAEEAHQVVRAVTAAGGEALAIRADVTESPLA